MRTTHQQLHLPHHTSRWWVTHTAGAVAGAIVVLYLAAVLLIMAGLFLL
jgi:hypothetical protein